MHANTPWLHRYALFTAGLTLILLCAGALVTSTASGLAVPDWPLSFGTFFPPMVGGVLYEHGHRLVAGSVGIATVGLVILFWRKEPRRWVRLLTVAALVGVVIQALLGRFTVLLRLPTSVSVAHACMAQLIFCIVMILVLVTSPSWFRSIAPLQPETRSWISLPVLSTIVSVGFFIQLLMGAMMRHTGAGLAIPDFPTVFGGFLPPTFGGGVGIHFAHRMGAYTLTALSAYLAIRIHRKQASQLDLITTVGMLLMLLSLQILLGATIVLAKRPVPITVLHLAVGALVLSTSVLVTLKIYRLKRLGPVRLVKAPLGSEG
jgi:heme a synthase